MDPADGNFSLQWADKLIALVTAVCAGIGIVIGAWRGSAQRKADDKETLKQAKEAVERGEGPVASGLPAMITTSEYSKMLAATGISLTPFGEKAVEALFAIASATRRIADHLDDLKSRAAEGREGLVYRMHDEDSRDLRELVEAIKRLEEHLCRQAREIANIRRVREEEVERRTGRPSPRGPR